MNKKEYIKPEMTVIKAELESLILGNSTIDADGNKEGSIPGGASDDDFAAKEDNSGSIWDSEW